MPSFRIYGKDEEELSVFLHNIEKDLVDLSCEDLLKMFEEHQTAEDALVADNQLSLPKYIPCACHKISLIASMDSIKYAENDKNFHKLFKSSVGKLQSLWSKCKSTKLTDLIEQRFESKLVTPNVTRWLSLFNAIRDFIEKSTSNGSKMEELFKDPDVKLVYPTKTEMLFLKEYVEVMSPLHAALKTLEGDKNTYWAFIAPSMRLVEKKLNKLTILQVCEPLKEGILKGIKKR